MSRFEVLCVLCDTSCIVTTLVLVISCTIHNVIVHGHENDPVLKLGRLYAFIFQHNFDVLDDFYRRFPNVNLPDEFQ